MEESTRVRAQLACNLNIPYGPSGAETRDVFSAPTSGAPIVIYSHGGAWTRTSKEHVSYPAESFVRAGATARTHSFSLSLVMVGLALPYA